MRDGQRDARAVFVGLLGELARAQDERAEERAAAGDVVGEIRARLLGAVARGGARATVRAMERDEGGEG